MKKEISQDAMVKFFLDENLLRYLKTFIDINPLLNTNQKLFNKLTWYDWYLTNEATEKYLNDCKFKKMLDSYVASHLQIHVNLNVIF